MNNIFVPIYNNFINNKKILDKDINKFKDNIYFLTAEELYLYYFLHSERKYKTDTTTTTINVLNKLITFYGRKGYKLDDKKNKIKIKELLDSLKQKQVINITIIEDNQNYNDNNKLFYSYILDISFNKIEGGYEPIDYYIFELTDNPVEFYLLCIFKKEKIQISYIELSSRLNCSERYVKKIIKNMNRSNKMINIIHGQYYEALDGTIKQEKNEYSVVDNKDNNKEVRSHNWYNYKAELTFEDYYIYRTTKDEQLIKKAKTRISKLKNNNFSFISWEERFRRERIQDKNNQNIIKQYKKEDQEIIDYSDLRNKQYDVDSIEDILENIN